MSKLKFLGMAAAFLLLAGCTVPLGIPGAYGGYGGYGGYGYNGYGGSNGYSPYGYSYPASPYGYSNGYSAGAPYYGYPSGPVTSGPPVVVDNYIPTPYGGINSTDPSMAGRDSSYWRRHARHHRRYRNGNNQEDPSVTDPTLTPGTDSTLRSRAGLNGRQGSWTSPSLNGQGSQLSQQQGVWGNQRYNRQGSQFSQQQATQQGQLANSRGFTFGQQPQMSTQQRRMRAPMAGQTMSRPMMQQNRAPTMAARRPTGNTTMRATRTAPRTQQSGNNQRRARRSF